MSYKMNPKMVSIFMSYGIRRGEIKWQKYFIMKQMLG